MISDFIDYIGINAIDFWIAVDRFADENIVEKREGNWRLRRDVEENLRGEL
ncbi:hypothetical protein CCP3SC1AL1_3950001 [Gammaproteobacteria bacterium]